MSSKRHQRETYRRKSCTGKRRHATENAAYAELRTRPKELQLVLTVYPCLFCNGHHVGHKSKAIYRPAPHPRIKRVPIIDWWGEWTEQRERFREDADQMALRAIHGRWLSDEQSVAEFVRECTAMF